ncbi:molybdopterin-binding protein [uncultured Tateyamaria sp.]|uniref:molybdopterin-binding protein n=1 Tax=uncultured Tateyamaria sp. TaxID=455651 RepID=UPI00261BD4B7|nr:molybdopterin-binding protein [uncultured Tateyamaria sp.]
MSDRLLTRRALLRAGMTAASASLLGGCKVLDGLSAPDNTIRRFMERANDLTMAMQRGVLNRDALATEYSAADIRQPQRPNGVTNPQDDAYLALKSTDFADYRLEVGGMVHQPLSLSLAQMRTMPVRRQITRHDCVEGWSCIADWTGVPLAYVLSVAGVRSEARYVLFHCFDTIERSLSGTVRYYETIDLVDARHPQTILAWGMNGAALPVPNGAPLRVRVERQLGYKMAKYIRAIELVDDFSAVGRGRGGYWEDRGYEWYAGI